MKMKVNVAHHFDVTKLTRISHTHTRAQHTYVSDQKKNSDNKNQSQKPWWLHEWWTVWIVQRATLGLLTNHVHSSNVVEVTIVMCSIDKIWKKCFLRGFLWNALFTSFYTYITWHDVANFLLLFFALETNVVERTLSSTIFTDFLFYFFTNWIDFIVFETDYHNIQNVCSTQIFSTIINNSIFKNRQYALFLL